MPTIDGFHATAGHPAAAGHKEVRFHIGAQRHGIEPPLQVGAGPLEAAAV
jgi:hypothetical protein